MTKEERQYFIDRMEEIGDEWEDDDVKRVYGKMSLQDALDDRMKDMQFCLHHLLFSLEKQIKKSRYFGKMYLSRTQENKGGSSSCSS